MQSIFALASIVAIAACDANHQLAGLNGPGANGGGTNGGNTTPQLVISPSTVQLTVGTTFLFSTNAIPAQQSQVVWQTLQPTVATVSQAGLVTAVGAGVATIVARYSFDTTNVATATVIANTTITAGSMAVGSRSP